jgi:hypothetical protein
VSRGTGNIPAVETAGYKMADVIGAFFLSQEQRLKNDFFTFNEAELQRHYSMRLGFVGNQ